MNCEIFSKAEFEFQLMAMLQKLDHCACRNRDDFTIENGLSLRCSVGEFIAIQAAVAQRIPPRLSMAGSGDARAELVNR
jgi:hypothetical protein